jgi:hypothetical protein
MSKYSKLAAKHLCWYDPASWSYTEVLDSPQPRDEMCECDPCYTGRDAVAVALLELEAENEALHKRHEHANAILAKLEAERDRLREALCGVISVADRNTDEFNFARAALEGK